MNNIDLTPRSLGCFEEVAKVIGEDVAERELQRVIGCGIVGVEPDHSAGSGLVFCFIWSASPQGEEFWMNIDSGIMPEQLKNKYWNGKDWPIPTGSTCVIKGCTSGTSFEAVVDYMDEQHCIWHWTDDNGTTIHNLVKYMEFSPVKSETEKAREKVFSQLEEFTGNDCSALMRTDVVEFVLKYYVEEK